MYPSNMQAMRKHEIESLRLNIEAAGRLCDLADEKITALKYVCETTYEVDLSRVNNQEHLLRHAKSCRALNLAVIAIEEFHQAVNRRNLETMKQQLNAMENPSGLVGVELGRKGLVG